MKRKSIIYVVVALLCLTGCKNKRHALKQLAVENLKQSVEYPKQLQMLAISEPDSAFGFSYFSQQEKAGIIRIMKSVTDSIMKRTNNMQSLDINDFYVMDLAERQMRANSYIRQSGYWQKGMDGLESEDRLSGSNASWHEIQC